MAIIAGLIAIATAIGGFLTQAWDLIREVGDWIRHALSTFMQVAPKPLRIFIYLFLLVLIGNVFSKFVLGSQYMCDSDNRLYKAPDYITGFAQMVRLNFFEWTISERDDYIDSNYQDVNERVDFQNVKCVEQQPALFFYSIDILDFKMWLLALMLIYGAPLVWGYYSRTGVLF